nr:MAG TPA: hypothetical protein [Caudoviricetes sp.]
MQVSKKCLPLQPQSREKAIKEMKLWCVSSVG